MIRSATDSFRNSLFRENYDLWSLKYVFLYFMHREWHNPSFQPHTSFNQQLRHFHREQTSLFLTLKLLYFHPEHIFTLLNIGNHLTSDPFITLCIVLPLAPPYESPDEQTLSAGFDCAVISESRWMRAHEWKKLFRSVNNRLQVSALSFLKLHVLPLQIQPRSSQDPVSPYEEA